MTPTLEYSGGVSANASSVVAVDDALMQAGDTRLAWISVSNTTVTGAPSGWSLLVSYAIASTRNGYLYRKTHAGGSEPATSTFTFGSANNHALIQAGIRTADTGALDFTPTTNTNTGTALTATGGTTVRDDQLVLVVFHLITNSATASFTGTTATSVLEIDGTGTAGHAAGLFQTTKPTAGAITSVTSTGSPSVPWGATLLALAEPAAGAAAVLPRIQPYTARRRAANY